MGLKSLTEEVFLHLGTRVKVVQFISLSNFPCLKKSMIASLTLAPIILHAFLKNLALKPSIPGALSSPISDSAFRISA